MLEPSQAPFLLHGDSLTEGVSWGRCHGNRGRQWSTPPAADIPSPFARQHFVAVYFCCQLKRSTHFGGHSVSVTLSSVFKILADFRYILRHGMKVRNDKGSWRCHGAKSSKQEVVSVVLVQVGVYGRGKEFK